MTLWLTGLAIGALFGFAWGFSAGQRSVIALPVTPETPYPDSAQGGERGENNSLA